MTQAPTGWQPGQGPPAPSGTMASPPRRAMSTRTILIGVVLVVVLGAAVTVLRGNGSTSTSGVVWSDYAAGLQGRIETERASGDCAGLQADFDAAAANSANTQARTGHGNSELMSYINDALTRAGCYH